MKPRTKLLFLSSIAVPQQIKLCHALQTDFQAEFWFYESPDQTRGRWWRIELGEFCKILGGVLFFSSGSLERKYFSLNLSKELNRFDPDIVMLGGFSIPGNIQAYRWARRNGKRTVVFTERSRNRAGVLRRRGLVWRMLRWLYRDVDLVITSADDAVSQYRDELGFGQKVVAGRYASDLDSYFAHPVRTPKPAYTYLFANRLTSIYNPLGAIEIFAEVLARYPGSRLLMNASGELGAQCREKIAEMGIESAVEFLSGIRSWDALHSVYARSDILIFPAHFSNGNYTILESMASGMGLVVSNRILGIGRMISDGANGFNCEPTTAAFVDRIERYIRDPKLFEIHSALNRKLAEPHTVACVASDVARLLDQRLNLSASASEMPE